MILRLTKLSIVLNAILFAVFPLAASAALNVSPDKFVRSANYYLRAGTDIKPADYPLLAKYDLLVLPAEAQVYNRSMFGELRRLNPHITILAYVPTKSFNHQYWYDSLHQKLAACIQDSWWLTDSSGARISIWPGTSMLNMVSPWSKALPEYVQQDIWSTGLWDGIFYDEFSVTVSWVNGGNIDIHRSGQRDDPHLADVAWERATLNMLRDTRNLLGPEAVIITNGDSAQSVQPFLNGRMFESFPTPWEGRGRWEDSTASYLRLQSTVGYKPVFVINGNSGNTGCSDDYQKVRFVLASALLGDGFFSFDFGEQSHAQLWWYDEQSVYLGAPLGTAINQTTNAKTGVVAGVWRRDFQNGAVLLNSTNQPQTIKFAAEFEHLLGNQDRNTNNGNVVTNVTLQPKDGILLLKPIEKIVNAVFLNGAYARVYDRDGNKIRNGFFSYEPPFDGSTRIIIKDIDGDGRLEKIVADKTNVSIFETNGGRRLTFAPYGADYKQGVNFALGDLNGDGRNEIVTGSGGSFEPRVRFFDLSGEKLGSDLIAYDPRFKGGVHVATGDLYGLGRDVIIVGAGPGGGPHVRVFDFWGNLWAQFFAYDWNFRGGVEVSAGDVDGNGRAEIVTGAGADGGPQVRVFSGYGRPLSGFFAGDPQARDGIGVSVADVDGDGKNEIIALTSNVFQISTQ